MINTQKNKAIFLYRDIVIDKKEKKYDFTSDNTMLLYGVSDAIKIFHKKGYMVYVVANEPEASTAEGAKKIMDVYKKAESLIEKDGEYFDGFYYCPHTKEDHCECMMPEPGLLIKAANENNLDLTISWIVGRTEEEMLTGMTAGTHRCIVQRYDGLKNLATWIQETYKDASQTKMAEKYAKKLKKGAE